VPRSRWISPSCCSTAVIRIDMPSCVPCTSCNISYVFDDVCKKKIKVITAIELSYIICLYFNIWLLFTYISLTFATSPIDAEFSANLRWSRLTFRILKHAYQFSIRFCASLNIFN
jgi:hypothetical protein